MSKRHHLLRHRALVLDACFQQRDRQWTWPQLAAAISDDERTTDPNAPSYDRSTVARVLRAMRSGELGYRAPIVVHHNKYYAYADAHFAVATAAATSVRPEDITQLHDLLHLVRSLPNIPAVAELDALAARLAQLIDQQPPPTDPRTLIQFDHLPDGPGQHWLPRIYPHVRDQRTARLTFQPFDEPAQQHTVSPYLLKEYNRRWYVVGYDHGSGDIRPFALDRILTWDDVFATPFYRHPRFVPQHWYRYLYGISVPHGAEPEFVHIRVNYIRTKYMDTKPWHPSQTRIADHPDGGATYQFFVIINFEWEQLLLSFADEITLLAPSHLRDKMRQRLLHAYHHC